MQNWRQLSSRVNGVPTIDGHSETTLGNATRSRFEIRVLGQTELLIGGAAVEKGVPEKAFVMFAALAMGKSCQVNRGNLRGLLWASSDAVKRAGNLRQLLSRIQLAVGNDPLLRSSDRQVAFFDPDQSVDVRKLMSHERLNPRDWHLLELELLDGVGELGSEGEHFLRSARERLNRDKARHIERILVEEEVASNLRHRLSSVLVSIDASSELGWRSLSRAELERGDVSAAKRAISQGMGHCSSVLASSQDYDVNGPLRTSTPEGSHRKNLPDERDAVPQIPRVMLLPPQVDPEDDLLVRLSRFLLEEITLGLSRQRLFKIVAAHTTFELVSSINLASDIRRLGVDYSVYVTLARDGHDIRITYRLTKVDTLEVLWGGDIPLLPEHFTSSFNSIGDRISMAVAGSIERHEMTVPAKEANSSAFRLYLEGKRNIVATDLRLLRGARRWFRASLRHFDGFALAHVGVARTLSLEYLLRSRTDVDLLNLAHVSVEKGLAIDPGTSGAFRELGYISLYRRKHSASIEHYAEARRLSPNDADMLADYADAFCHDGRLDEALELIETAYTLNPLPSDYYHWYLGGIHFMREDYEKALEALASVREKPTVARLMTAIHAERGDINSARRYAEILIEHHPDFRTEHLYSFIPDRRHQDTARLAKALNLAGLV